MNRCLQGTQIPDWMTKGKTTIIQKDPRPMWKILSAQIREKFYFSLTNRRRTERMPQRIKRHSRITLYRSIHPKWELGKTEKSTCSLDWPRKGIWYGSTKLDYTLSQNVQNEVINVIKKIMQTWRVELTTGGRSLAETKIQRGIFQGDALSPSLFIIAMMPLNHIPRKCIADCKRRSIT